VKDHSIGKNKKTMLAITVQRSLVIDQETKPSRIYKDLLVLVQIPVLVIAARTLISIRAQMQVLVVTTKLLVFVEPRVDGVLILLRRKDQEVVGRLQGALH
jgi:hypothetical protein